MTQQIIDIGSLPSDGSGDPLRVSFDKINQNFTELYSVLMPTPGGNSVPLIGTVTSVAGKVGNVVLTVDNIIGAVSQNYVDNKVGELVYDSINDQIIDIAQASPEIVDDIRQLANAIQNDAGYYMSITTQLTDKVSKTTGGVMTAPLLLRGNPVSPTEAAPKQYVDAKSIETLQTVNSTLQITNMVVTSLASQIDGLATTAALTAMDESIRGAVYTKEEIDAILLNITNGSSIDNPYDAGYIGADPENDLGSVTETSTEMNDYGSI